MRGLARGSSSNCRNPALDFWAFSPTTGGLADVFALGFQVFDVSTEERLLEPVQVYPATEGETAAVDVATTCPTAGAGRIREGHYVATWTPAADHPLGRHRVVWSVEETDGAEVVEYRYDFDVLAAGLRPQVPLYALLSDLRAEGVTEAALSDARALAALHRASLLIERWTRRWFEPRWRRRSVDGSAGPVLHLRDPIIALASGTIDGDAVDASGYRTYARHLTDGLTDPDDRLNPRIEFARMVRTRTVVDQFGRQLVGPRSIWWPGPRNIVLEGVFGYTDFDPDYPVGSTPELIKRATMLLAIRDSTKLGDTDARFDAANAYRITDMRTRDQSISYGKSRAETGASTEFSGDPEIDSIIELFMPPPVIRAV